MQELEVDESGAASYYLAALIVFTVARFGFTWMLKKFSGASLLALAVLLAVALLVIVIFVGGMPGTVSLVAVSGCMSLMFPTIFGLASEGLEADRKLGGSVIIMAILGGAVLTALQGYVSDRIGIHLSFLVPVACFFVVAWFGHVNRGRHAR